MFSTPTKQQFSCSLTHARLSYLLQHVIKGRSILPGTAMFEAAYAASRTLIADSKSVVGLTSSNIVAPLLLSRMGSSDTELCCLLYKSNIVEVSSLSASAFKATSHLRGQIEIVNAAAVHSHSVQQSVSAAIPVLKPSSTLEWSYLCDVDGQQSCLPADGYHTDPAVLDAVTHLGAVADVMDGHSVRVPSSLDNYISPPVADKLRKKYTGSSQHVWKVHGGARLTSFRLDQGLTIGCLDGLCSKPIIVSGGTKDESVKSLENALSTYAVSVQAAHPLIAVVGLHSSTMRQRVQIHIGSVVDLTASILSKDGCKAFQSALEAYQSTGFTKSFLVDAPWCPSTVCGTGGGAAEAYSLQGMLKVAALQNSACKFGIHMIHSNQIGYSTQPCDQFGVYTSGGMEWQPKLLRTMQQPASAPGGFEFDSSNCHIISGGTSGIGALVADHLTDIYKQQVVLLGRGGLLGVDNKQQHKLKHSYTEVHILMCDVSSCVDVDECVGWLTEKVNGV